MSITAYKRTISDTESRRQIEWRVLSSVTAELESRQLDFDQAQKPGEKLAMLANGLRDSLWYNERIWMTMRNDLAESGNALSPDLRAGLISLALWVETHTQGVMKGEKKIKPLLDVNRSIIRGLEGNPMHVME
jgi:flagellar protein FlaF